MVQFYPFKVSDELTSRISTYNHTSSFRTLINPDTLQDLKIYSEYTAVGQCDIKWLQRWNCTYCQKDRLSGTQFISEFASNDTQYGGYTAINHIQKRIIVSFRGSRNRLNWILNFKAYLSILDVSVVGVKVHHGFKKIYMSVKDEIRNIVLPFAVNYSDYTIVYTGHRYYVV